MNTIQSNSIGSFTFIAKQRSRLTASLWLKHDEAALKQLTSVLHSILPSSKHCTHLRGHRDLKGAVRAASDFISQYRIEYHKRPLDALWRPDVY